MRSGGDCMMYQGFAGCERRLQGLGDLGLRSVLCGQRLDAEKRNMSLSRATRGEIRVVNAYAPRMIRPSLIEHRGLSQEAREGVRWTRVMELCAAVVLFVVLGTQLFVRLSVIQACYKLESLRKEALVADADLRELRLMYAWKTQPSTMVARSRASLNMEPSTPSQIRRVAVEY